MRKYILVISLFLLFPLFSLAAYDTVQFPQDTNVYLTDPGITIVVKAGSKVSSFTVYTDHLHIVFEAGSQISLVSYDRRTFSNSMNQKTDCYSSYSVLNLSASDNQETDIYPVGNCALGENLPSGNYEGGKPSTENGEVIANSRFGARTSLLLPDGSRVILDIPPQAVEDGTTFQISSLDKESLENLSLSEGERVISAFDISATLGGQEVHRAAKPLTLAFVYPDSLVSGVDETTLSFYRYEGSSWTQLSTIRSQGANTITTSLRDFSPFVVVGKELSSGQGGSQGQGGNPPLTVEEIQNQIREICEQLIALLNKAIAQLQLQILQLQAKGSQ